MALFLVALFLVALFLVALFVRTSTELDRVDERPDFKYLRTIGCGIFKGVGEPGFQPEAVRND